MIKIGSVTFRRQTVVLIGILVVLMLAATLFGLVETLELGAVSVAFGPRGPQAPTSPIMIVAIDDNTFSINNLQWPWPRTYFAQLVDQLAAGGAKAIAFDVFFTDPEDFGKPATYTVRGETLPQIAKQYGVSAQAIIQANNLPAGGRICAGQKLTIPTTPSVEHTVAGDTLDDIAARYQITNVGALMKGNGLSDRCDILSESAKLLRIPVQGSLIYTVKAGDTVKSIAEAYQVNPLAVVIAEGVPATDPLVTGQTLTVGFGDAALAASIKATGIVVLNGQIIDEQQAGYAVKTLKQPIPSLLATAAGFGLTNLRTEVDGVVHQVQAWNKAQDQFYYSWPMMAASLYTGQPLSAQPAANGFKLGDRTVPLDRGDLRVNFVGPEGTIPTISALSVVNGDVFQKNPDTFKGKIVFIGATTESLHDTYPTPFFDQQKPTPGVEIMGNALETLLSGRFLRRASPVIALLSVALAGAVAFALTFIRRTGLAAIALFSLMAAYVVVWLGAFFLLRYEMPLIAPEIMVFVGFVFPSLERAISEELEKRRVRGIFELFISPEMVSQLIEQGVDAMRGKRLELTILFSDIRGFTTMSEKMTPEELVNLLNEYLGAMTDVIHKHGGTVDKYEGDLVMAFFGAPIAYPDHAERAVRCSIDMRMELDRLRQKWEGEGKPSRLEMGIGLNTAEVFVGLVGSGRRVNYTVMGDGVNLASRIQDLTKDLKWPLLISEYTYERVKDKFEIEFGEAKLVKGKTVPVGMYKVISEKGAPEERRVRPLFA